MDKLAGQGLEEKVSLYFGEFKDIKIYFEVQAIVDLANGSAQKAKSDEQTICQQLNASSERHLADYLFP